MHDTLELLRSTSPIHRRYHHDELTFALIYAFTENFVLPLSHDEVVHGKGSLLDKMPGDDWQKFANLRALYALHVGPPGQEAAVHGRRVRPGAGVEPRAQPRLAPARAAPSTPASSAGARPEPPLPRRPGAVPSSTSSPAGFRWIDADDARRQRASPSLRFARDGRGAGRALRTSRRSPRRATGSACRAPGRWREVLEHRRRRLRRRGRRNLRRRRAEARPWHGQPHSAELTLPPLGVVWLAPDE